MERIFSHKIISWYQQNKRDLPWRETKDPYKIWLSEIILQQTRVAQGMPYYFSFIESFPTVFDLARANEQEILKLWQGLGYYSRARNLHFTAKTIVDQYNGIFPNNYTDLLKLKGIGDYTASAIASFCFNEAVPTVDGNVFRVLSRYFGNETPINSSLAKKEFKNIALELIDNENSGLFNQSMMEFGALQCIPASPNCSECILNDSCVALQKNKVSDFPFNTKKMVVKKRFFNYLVFRLPHAQTVIQKREKNDIWKHLYEFPLIESTEEFENETFIKSLANSSYHTKLNNPKIKLINPNSIKHKLTHQEIFVKFWEISVQKIDEPMIKWNDLNLIPFPIIIHNFIEKYLKDY
jgi:A/G-specific adenine glycosylase